VTTGADRDLFGLKMPDNLLQENDMPTVQRLQRSPTIPGAVAVTVASAAGGSATAQTVTQDATPTQLVDALNGVFGKHAGARAVHAKGVVLEGTFMPSPSAVAISKAPHLQKSSVPVTVRFSDFAGIPDIPDNHELSSPRGLAIKFHLPDGTETDIVAHSFNGWPSPTAADFRDLLVALGSSGPDVPKPTPLDAYLESHPAAKAFLTAPKPPPVSFATLPYYGVNAFKFVNAEGHVSYGRYQIVPLAGAKYLTADQAAAAAPDYLMNEIRDRVTRNGPVQFKLTLQLADPSDDLNSPSVPWPESRRVVELGLLKITKVEEDKTLERKLLFLPNTPPSGIEVQDPMVAARGAAYPISYARRQ
jgi:catalase